MERIIINWMTPRSLTTVFMRAISERGDFQTIFEPFLPLYWQNRVGEKGVVHKDYKGWPTEYNEIKEKLFKLAENRPLFIKECPLHAIDKLINDKDLLNNCFHMFQIRHPKLCVLSSWKLRGTQKRQLADSGFDASYKLFQVLTNNNLHPLDNGKTPLVIDGEDFQENTEGIMKAWCKAVKVPYKPEALQWEPEWREEYSHWEECYYDIAKSKGVQKRMEAFLYDDLLHKAIFEDLPLLKVCYEYHLPYYEKMYPYRLKPIL